MADDTTQTDTTQTQDAATATMDPEGEQFRAVEEALRTGDMSSLQTQETTETNTESTETETAKPETPDETKKNEALKKELDRVRQEKREAEQANQEIRERLANLEGQAKAKQQDTLDEVFAKATDAQLIEAGVQWQDIIRQSEAEGDSNKLAQARQMLVKVETEKYDRIKRNAAKDVELPQRKAKVEAQLDGIYKTGREALPDLENPDSELSKAAAQAIQDNPDLFNELGPLRDMLAVATAIVKNPGLVSNGVAKKATKQLAKTLEQTAESALKSGAGPATGGETSVDFSKSPMNDMEALIERAKQGDLSFLPTPKG